MAREFKPGDKVTCVVEQQLPNCLLLRFQNGKGGSKNRIFRGVLLDESCSATKRIIKGSDISSKPALTKELTKQFIQDCQSSHVSGKFLRNKRRQNCLVLDDFYIDYHNTSVHHDESSRKLETFENEINADGKASNSEKVGEYKNIKGVVKEVGNDLTLIHNDTAAEPQNKGPTLIDREIADAVSRRKGIPKRCAKYSEKELEKKSQNGEQTPEISDKSFVASKRFSRRGKASRPKRFFGSEFYMKPDPKQKISKKKKQTDPEKTKEGEEVNVKEMASSKKHNKGASNKYPLKSKEMAITADEKLANNEYKIEDYPEGERKSPRKPQKRSYEPDIKNVKNVIVIDTKRQKIVRFDTGLYQEEISYKTSTDSENDFFSQDERNSTNELATREIQGKMDDFLVSAKNEEKVNGNLIENVNFLESKVNEQNDKKNIKKITTSPLKRVTRKEKLCKSPAKVQEVSKLAVFLENDCGNSQKRITSPGKKSGDSKHEIKYSEKETRIPSKTSTQNNFSHEMLICNEGPFDEHIDRDAEFLNRERRRKQAERVLGGKIKVLESGDIVHLTRLREIEELKKLTAEGKTYVMLDLKEAGVKESGEVNSGRKAMTIEVSALDLTKHNIYQQKAEGKGLFQMTIPTGMKTGSTRASANDEKLFYENSKSEKCAPSGPVDKNPKTDDVLILTQADAFRQEGALRQVSVIADETHSKQNRKKKQRDVADCNVLKIIIDKSKGTVSIPGLTGKPITDVRNESRIKNPEAMGLQQKLLGEEISAELSRGTSSVCAESSNADTYGSSSSPVRQQRDAMNNPVADRDNDLSSTKNEGIVDDSQACFRSRSGGRSENGDPWSEEQRRNSQQSGFSSEYSISEDGDAWESKQEITIPQNEFECMQKLNCEFEEENYSAEEVSSTIVREECKSTATAAYAQLSFQRLVASAHAEKLKAKIDMSWEQVSEAEVHPEEKGEEWNLEDERKGMDERQAKCSMIQKADCSQIEGEPCPSEESSTGGRKSLQHDKALVVALSHVNSQRSLSRKNPFRNDRLIGTLQTISEFSSTNVRKSSTEDRREKGLWANLDTHTLCSRPISGIENMERRIRDMKNNRISSMALIGGLPNEPSAAKPDLVSCKAEQMRDLKCEETNDQVDSERDSFEKISSDKAERKSKEAMIVGSPFPSPFYTKVANENVTVKVLRFERATEKKNVASAFDNCEPVKDPQIAERDKDNLRDKDSLDHGHCFCYRDDRKSRTMLSDFKVRTKSSWKCLRTGLRKYPTVDRSLRGHLSPGAKKNLTKQAKFLAQKTTYVEAGEQVTTVAKKASVAREQGEELLKQMLKLNKGLFLKAETNQICRKGERTGR